MKLDFFPVCHTRHCHGVRLGFQEVVVSRGQILSTIEFGKRNDMYLSYWMIVSGIIIALTKVLFVLNCSYCPFHMPLNGQGCHIRLEAVQ